MKQKKKAKLSMMESFKYILQSPYLGLIAMLVLAYGVSINLFEGVWKGKSKLLSRQRFNITKLWVVYLL